MDRRLVQVTVGVAEVTDGDGDDSGEQEAVAEASAEDAEHPDRQVSEADLGLKAAVAVAEADFAGRVGAVEEVEHRAEDRGDSHGHHHPPDQEDFQRAGGAARLAVAVTVDRGTDQRDCGEDEKRHGSLPGESTGAAAIVAARASGALYVSLGHIKRTGTALVRARDNGGMAKKAKDGVVAVRASVRGEVQGVGFREMTVRRAGELNAMGWVRNGEDGVVLVHAEGPEPAVEEMLAFLREGPPAAKVAEVEVERVKSEGHEQFAVRGVSAGVFVVQEHAATARHFDLRLEVDGVMRSWAVPKGPTLDPAVKRLAVQVEDHALSHNDFEGATEGGGVIVWDRGRYEQGGRVPWPEALERGHAVFVLHGEKLRGGFALQRTRPGEKPQWLLIKRRDDEAQPGSEVVAERPESVASGGTLDELLGTD